MSIQVVFEKGRAKIMGDGLEQGSFNEHELIRQIARIIGGKVVDDRELLCHKENLNCISRQWGQ